VVDWPDFGLTRLLNCDKRCEILSKSSHVNAHVRWSRQGVKISTDQMLTVEGVRRPCQDSRSWEAI
jgi:hypothetical protein